MSLSKFFSALLLLPLLAAAPCALADPLYTLTFLPGDFSAAALAQNGQVVGSARGGAAVWSTTSTTYLASLLPGSEGLAINSAGAIAGRVGASAFVYADGGLQTFALPTPLATWATGINDAGQVSGTGRLGFGEHTGFRYSGGVFTEMGNFGGALSVANAINAGGDLAGFAGFPTEAWFDPDRHAAVYRDGTLLDLGTLGGRISEANDINDAGFVAGWSELAGGSGERPFLFSPGQARMSDLGSLGGSAGRANGINNAGTVVGLSDIGGPDGFDYHAFVYGASGMADLNTLVGPTAGWTLVSALDVNDAGQILAQACNASLAECRAVRLDLIAAVPEPGAWAMLAGGVVLLLWRARKRTLWIVAPVLAAPLLASAQALPSYTPSFLPAGFTATAINARGQVAGLTANAAALWDSGVLTEYTAAAPGSFAFALDNRGQMAGGWAGDSYVFAAGGVRNVGRQGLWHSSFAIAINDLGAIAGRSYWGVGERSRGYVLAGGVLRMIPSFGGDWSDATAINRSGQVAGTAAVTGDAIPEPNFRAFVYKDKAMRNLGTLGGRNSSASDINDAGQVAGFSWIAEVDEFDNPRVHAFLYAGGVMQDIGTLGGDYSSALGINNAGIVVGESTVSTPDGIEQRAFGYAGGAMLDLNTRATMPAGWLLVSARDVNDAGQVLAQACSLEDCLYLRLDPVP
ncbi:HAF repeat/PEP-CTERM domain-containing protein [Massilia yuzhufengensis]|uniref:PEP-CTERM protein-sorting domain-containing protein n=1 Tax=Massilia yuzhufengensis TaxID=1164594 RepID=A0A1I1DF38_9BURK|nr:HAF repeat/PEP-CTERM domain-containing protein [Massilia yuzhufengensis]SFB73575.1 PEP-CTERM protein-sorting domain-containing protein [Massilia yuzhufengensis]